MIPRLTGTSVSEDPLLSSQAGYNHLPANAGAGADRAGTAGIAERSVIHGKQTEVCSISTHPNAASPETRMTAGLPGMCFSFPLIATKVILLNFCDLWCSE